MYVRMHVCVCIGEALDFIYLFIYFIFSLCYLTTIVILNIWKAFLYKSEFCFLDRPHDLFFLFKISLYFKDVFILQPHPDM
jgi:hypothetical protein